MFIVVCGFIYFFGINMFIWSNGDDYSEEIESEDDDNVLCNGNSDI